METSNHFQRAIIIIGTVLASTRFHVLICDIVSTHIAKTRNARVKKTAIGELRTENWIRIAHRKIVGDLFRRAIGK